MSVKPDFILSRSGTSLTIDFRNRDGKLVSVYVTESHNKEVELEGQYDEDQVIISVAPDSNAAVLARYRELDLSINILEDNSGETPPWWLAEPVGDTTFTGSTGSFNPSWGSEVVYDTILVDNLQEGTKSQKKYTKA